jgi:hypothetical protein
MTFHPNATTPQQVLENIEDLLDHPEGLRPAELREWETRLASYRHKYTQQGRLQQGRQEILLQARDRYQRAVAQAIRTLKGVQEALGQAGPFDMEKSDVERLCPPLQSVEEVVEARDAFRRAFEEAREG